MEICALTIVMLALTLPSCLGSNVGLVCPTLEYTSVNCDDCALSNDTSNTNGSIFTERLRQYLASGEIKFLTENAEIRWTFPLMFEVAHTYVTLYYKKDQRFATPIPGCCGIPMKESHCAFSDIDSLSRVVKSVYVGFTLFRTRLVESLNLTLSPGADSATRKDQIPRVDTDLMEPMDAEEYVYFPTSGEYDRLPESDYNWKLTVHYDEPEQSGSNRFEDYQFYNDTEYITQPPIVTTTALIASPPQPEDVRPWEKYLRAEDAKRYGHVCVFDIPKGQVLSGKSVASPYSVDHYLFQREVYDMPGYFYKEDRVFHTSQPGVPVNCSGRSFAESPQSVYKLSWPNPNHDTFTCLVLWLTIRLDDAVEVKCMPHNVTYVEATPAPDTAHRPAKDQATTILIISFSAVGGLIFLVLAIVLTLKLAQALNTLVAESKRIPTTLDAVLNCDNRLEANPDDESDEFIDIPTWTGGFKRADTMSLKEEETITGGKARREVSDVKNFEYKQVDICKTALNNPTYLYQANGVGPHVAQDKHPHQACTQTSHVQKFQDESLVGFYTMADPASVSSTYITCVDSNLSCPSTARSREKFDLTAELAADEQVDASLPYRDQQTFLPIEVNV